MSWKSSSSAVSSSSQADGSITGREDTSHSGSTDPDSENESQDKPNGVTPVLSHAERRRQKRKAEKEAFSSKPPQNKKRKVDSANAPAQHREQNAGPRRQNSVWVGNLCFKTTVESLKAFFDGVGEITRVHMPTKASQRGPTAKTENRGFAYVDFATPESKAAAIAKSEQPLMGRRLLIKDGDDFTGRPVPTSTDGIGNSSAAKASNPGTEHSKWAQKILRAQTQRPAPTLFLGNLGFKTTEESIRELFEAHRPWPGKQKGRPEDDSEAEAKGPWIRKVRMGTFEDSGLCKGFAFIDFTSTENATGALINPKNHHLDGRNIIIEYASPEAVRRGGNAPRPPRQAKDLGQRSPLHAVSARPEKYEAEVADADQPAAVDVKTAKAKKFQSRRSHATGGKQQRLETRPKPGAALALAKRESAAIIPSQGKKIKF